MIVYRLSQFKYANDLSGKGAEKYGGRWNSIGNAMLYTSSSRALAMTEVIVNLLGNTITQLTYAMTTINAEGIDSTDIARLDKLPNNWNEIPHNNKTQTIGDKFLQQTRFLVLEVPSAVVKGDFNYVFNPMHEKFDFITVQNIDPFDFDKRLVRLD